jgi:hypothetical protein
MAEPILHKSPHKKRKKSVARPDSGIWLNFRQPPKPVIIGQAQSHEGLNPTIETANIHSLPGIADHFAGILEESGSNPTHLHDWLSEIEKTMVKGGGR